MRTSWTLKSHLSGPAAGFDIIRLRRPTCPKNLLIINLKCRLCLAGTYRSDKDYIHTICTFANHGPRLCNASIFTDPSVPKPLSSATVCNRTAGRIFPQKNRARGSKTSIWVGVSAYLPPLFLAIDAWSKELHNVASRVVQSL